MGRYKYKLSNEKLIEEYVVNGLGMGLICKKYGLAVGGIQRRLKKMTQKGLIPGELAGSRNPKRRLPDAVYLLEYPTLGMLAIAKKYNVSCSVVWLHLRKLGIMDSSRQNKKREGPRRSRRLSKHEFLASTRRQRFQEEGGCCEICHKLIGDGTNYQLALYHHIKLSSFGGGREPENCMVLHPECHQEHFRELHGYDWNKMLEGYTKR